MWMALIASVAGVLFFALGLRYPRLRQPALRSGLAADLLHAVTNGVLLDLPIAFALQGVSRSVEHALGSGSLSLLRDEPLWLQAIVFLVLGDLVKWNVHMLHHRLPILWRFHRLHHSTQEMDALSAARSHPVEVFVNRIIFLSLFVVVAGIDMRIVLGYSALDLLQGLWIHSNTHLRTRWLNYLLSTQEFHHWHHANDPAAVNKNYGGFLSVWDWIFGTAYCPRDREVLAFGIPDFDAPTRYRDHLLVPFRPSGVGCRPDRSPSRISAPHAEAV